MNTGISQRVYTMEHGIILSAAGVYKGGMILSTARFVCMCMYVCDHYKKQDDSKC